MRQLTARCAVDILFCFRDDELAIRANGNCRFGLFASGAIEQCLPSRNVRRNLDAPALVVDVFVCHFVCLAERLRSQECLGWLLD